MPSIIDALIVTLGLDPSGFTKGAAVASQTRKRMTEEEAAAAKASQEVVKRQAESYRKLGAEVLGLFAIFTAGRGVEQFARDITNSDAAAGRLAHNLNMSVENLTAWEGAAQRAGGSAAGMDGSLQGLTSQFQQFTLTGQSAVLPYFRQLGVNIADASGKLRPMGDILLDLADKFKGMDPARAQTFGAALGLDPGTINLLEQGRAAVQKLLDQQKQLGLPSGRDATNAQNLQNDLLDVQQAVTSLARTLLNDLSPKIHSILSTMDAWLQKNREWLAQKITDVIQHFSDIVAGINWTAVGQGIESFSTHVGGAVDSLNGWIGVTEVLLGLWVGSKFLNVLAAVGKLKFALGALAISMLVSDINAPGTILNRLTEWVDNRVPWLRGLDNYLGLGSGKASEAAPTTAEQKSRSKSAIDYFKSQGWSAEQAAGIVGNLQQESGFNPQSGKGTAHQGIAQWSAERQADIEGHFHKALMDMSYTDQLAAVQWELTEGKYKAVGTALRQASTARQAAAIVDHGYESPGNYLAEDHVRGANAEARLREYQGSSSDNSLQDKGPAAVAEGAKGFWNWLKGTFAAPTDPAPSGPQTSQSLATKSRYVPSANSRWGDATQGAVSNDNSSETHIHGPINIQTQATDAKGIATDMRSAMNDRFAVQANTGLA